MCSEPDDAAREIMPDRCPGPTESLAQTELEPTVLPYLNLLCLEGCMAGLAEMFPSKMFATNGKCSKQKKISY